MTIEELRRMPKVELHCHLDGSLSKEFIERRLSRKVIQQELGVSDDCGSLAEYLEKFELPLECLKDAEGLEESGYDVLKTMHQEHVIYAEIRFAPLLSVSETMDAEQVISALLRGLKKGKEEFGVEYNVIVCAMRHHGMEENYDMIQTACKFLGKGVCGADLAGAEAQYPMSEFVELFHRVRKLGMPFTIHAGECGSVKNIVDSVQAGAARIGHGIAMRGDASVQNLVKKSHVAVEMCPISNLQTKAVKSMNEYPLREFLEKGLSVTINTDNRTVSNTSLTKELDFIQRNYGINDEQIRQMMQNAAKAAFTDEKTKMRLLEKLQENIF